MLVGARVAVFVNEFGATDIDGDLIRWQGSIDEARRGTGRDRFLHVPFGFQTFLAQEERGDGFPFWGVP